MLTEHALSEYWSYVQQYCTTVAGILYCTHKSSLGCLAMHDDEAWQTRIKIHNVHTRTCNHIADDFPLGLGSCDPKGAHKYEQRNWIGARPGMNRQSSITITTSKTMCIVGTCTWLMLTSKQYKMYEKWATLALHKWRIKYFIVLNLEILFTLYKGYLQIIICSGLKKYWVCSSWSFANVLFIKAACQYSLSLSACLLCPVLLKIATNVSIFVLSPVIDILT